MYSPTTLRSVSDTSPALAAASADSAARRGGRLGHRAHYPLDQRQRRRRDAEAVVAQAKEQYRAQRLGGHLAAHAYRDPGSAADLEHVLQLADDRRVVGREPVGQARVAAIDRQRVLREIIGPDAEECAYLGQAVGDEHRRGRLDHDPHGHRFGGPDARAPERLALLEHDLAGLLHFLHQRDERQHELDVPVHRGAEDGADLGPEHLGLVEADADRAPAEERIAPRTAP